MLLAARSVRLIVASGTITVFLAALALVSACTSHPQQQAPPPPTALGAAIPGGDRVLEIGTGAGVGLAWLVHGLGARRDVEVVTAELDDQVQRAALSALSSAWVRLEPGDGVEVVGRLGQLDLIFPDAPGRNIVTLQRPDR